jgi:tetratricopeptide (TPR) repeat protein
MQARFMYAQQTNETLEQAVELYRQALGIDPGYAAAWAGLASSYLMQVRRDLRAPDDGIVRAREAIDKALEVDPDCADAHVALGRIALRRDHDLSAASRHFARALTLDPGNPETLQDAAFLARNLGRYDDAIAIGEYAVARDPVSPYAHHILGIIYQGAGRYGEAIASLRQSLRLNSSSMYTHSEIGFVLLLKGNHRAALAEMELEPSESNRLSGLAMAYYALGRRDESDAALRDLIRLHGQDSTYEIAWTLAFRGEPDRAFEWLDKSLAVRDPLVYGALGNRLLDKLHDDARWLPFLRMAGIAPDQVAAIEFKVSLPRMESGAPQ